MRIDFTSILSIDPLPEMLKSIPPFIRLQIYENIFELPDDSDTMDDVRKQCWRDDEFLKEARNQDENGLWPPRQEFSKEHHKAGIQFFSQVIKLHSLLTLGGAVKVDEVQKGIVALLKMQQEDGKFPLFYQHQGYALWVLINYGLQGNPFVDRGMRWLLKRQREDGGWLHPVQVPRGQEEEDFPSCIWTTAHALWPLVLHNVYSKDKRVTKGIEYLLDNFLNLNHTAFFNTPDAWDYLYIGHDETACFRGGTLKMLEIAINGGFDRSHPVIKKASNWLREQQLDNGFFPAIAGKDTQGDYLVTVRALTVLKKLFPESVIID